MQRLALVLLAACSVDYRVEVAVAIRLTGDDPAGATVDLTSIELKMLDLFLRSGGRLLTRAQIVDEVWGTDVFVTDRVVDTHIVKLRRKIERNPAEPGHIVSVRGLGYRFDA